MQAKLDRAIQSQSLINSDFDKKNTHHRFDSFSTHVEQHKKNLFDSMHGVDKMRVLVAYTTSEEQGIKKFFQINDLSCKDKPSCLNSTEQSICVYDDAAFAESGYPTFLNNSSQSSESRPRRTCPWTIPTGRK